MLPPPPRSTLFPYTTLFRSSGGLTPALTLLQSRPGGRAEARGTSDRKSTRLNSSHQIISYAVFCLKKKNLSLNVEKLGLSSRELIGSRARDASDASEDADDK